MAAKAPSKDALCFVFKCLYLKNESGDTHLLESDLQAKLKLSARLT